MFVQHIDLVYLVLPLALTSFVFQVIARPFPSPVSHSYLDNFMHTTNDTFLGKGSESKGIFM
jgi:hypothetical protein